MPLGEYERQVLLFNLHVQMVPQEASEVEEMTVSDVIATLKELFDAGKAHMRVGEFVGEPDEEIIEAEAAEATGQVAEGENVILIRSMRIDKDGVVSILLHHGDPRAADPPLMEITNEASPQTEEVYGRLRNILVDL